MRRRSWPAGRRCARPPPGRRPMPARSGSGAIDAVVRTWLPGLIERPAHRPAPRDGGDHRRHLDQPGQGAWRAGRSTSPSSSTRRAAAARPPTLAPALAPTPAPPPAQGPTRSPALAATPAPAWPRRRGAGRALVRAPDLHLRDGLGGEPGPGRGRPPARPGRGRPPADHHLPGRHAALPADRRLSGRRRPCPAGRRVRRTRCRP